MKAESIRWRIQRWHGALLTVVVIVMATVFFLYESAVRRERIERDLSYAVSALIPRLLPPGPRIPRGRAEEIFEERVAEAQRRDRGAGAHSGMRPIGEILGDPAMYYVAWTPRGEVEKRSGNVPADLEMPTEGLEFGETMVRERGEYLEAIHLTPTGGCVLVGIPLRAVRVALAWFGAKLALGSAALIALGLGVGWWLLGRETRQIAMIAESAERIAHGDPAERIQLPETSRELRHLTDVLNESFARLENSFSQQVRFTADASHELRTPVTVILTKGQFALAKERPAEKYVETIETCVEAARHMRGMIEALLELARFDSGEAALQLADADLAVVARETVDLLAVLAEDKGIAFELDLTPAPARMDAARMHQVCINLIANALKFSPSARRVTVSTAIEGDACRLVVADEGPGIAEADLPYLFDRFFRGREGRQNREGHTGLGLAIVKAVVSAHGGSVQAGNRAGGGAVFRVMIPAKGPAEAAV